MQKQPYTDIQYHQEPDIRNFPIVVVWNSCVQFANYLHYHHELEFGICLDGSGIFYIGNEIYPFGPLDISVVFPGEPHIARSSNGLPSHWNFITLHAEVLLTSFPEAEELLTLAKGEHKYMTHGEILPFEVGHTIRPYLLRMLSLYQEKVVEEPHLTALLACILYDLRLHRSVPPQNVEQERHMDHAEAFHKIEPAVNCLLMHCTRPVRTEELCELCHISPVHLRRLFETVFGLSPLAFQHKIRIRRACAMLRNSGDTITTIAQNAGYPSLSSFNRQFLKMMGMTPTDYQNLHGK